MASGIPVRGSEGRLISSTVFLFMSVPDTSIIDVPLATGSGDLVSGSKNTHIATLVDRKSRYTIILKLKGKDAASVTHALTEKFNELPNELRRTLTWDRGMELAKHTEFTASTDMPVYFCDPQSPLQRGTNENTNSLIRQYLPKKTCLAQHSQEVLNQIADELNDRPRKTLKFKTPKHQNR